MKKNICLLFISLSIQLFSQVAENTNCERPTFLCRDTTFDYSNSGVNPCSNIYRWYYFEVTSNMAPTITSNDSLLGFTLYGAFTAQLANGCAAFFDSVAHTFNQSSARVSGSVGYGLASGVGQLTPGYYYLRVKQKNCHSNITFFHRTGDFKCVSPPCDDCIGSFSPNTQKKYMISAWAKQSGALPTITNYTAPKLTVLTNSTSYSVSFFPSGVIIDGWQKIDGEFTLPSAATDINIKLECLSGDCFFDDIRVFPFDGSMKSYVYDPINMRLVAELDERNYATLYEYDEEGKLVRVKKETEKGIMTIKENRNNSSK